eukprot:TRINITY_DN124101_c0_g1_i1.p1 TRINITY_DN124101_c0_g1~~TRINITY_DN124101_c0_g1_i1.p1  ORF type:complete len:731 (+),score=171.16 TRINITY_DN124101_c0_g1_i1:67-2259(+)
MAWMALEPPLSPGLPGTPVLTPRQKIATEQAVKAARSALAALARAHVRCVGCVDAPAQAATASTKAAALEKLTSVSTQPTSFCTSSASSTIASASPGDLERASAWQSEQALDSPVQPLGKVPQLQNLARISDVAAEMPSPSEVQGRLRRSSSEELALAIAGGLPGLDKGTASTRRSSRSQALQDTWSPKYTSRSSTGEPPLSLLGLRSSSESASFARQPPAVAELQLRDLANLPMSAWNEQPGAQVSVAAFMSVQHPKREAAGQLSVPSGASSARAGRRGGEGDGTSSSLPSPAVASRSPTSSSRFGQKQLSSQTTSRKAQSRAMAAGSLGEQPDEDSLLEDVLAQQEDLRSKTHVIMNATTLAEEMAAKAAALNQAAARELTAASTPRSMRASTRAEHSLEKAWLLTRTHAASEDVHSPVLQCGASHASSSGLASHYRGRSSEPEVGNARDAIVAALSAAAVAMQQKNAQVAEEARSAAEARLWADSEAAVCERLRAELRGIKAPPATASAAPSAAPPPAAPPPAMPPSPAAAISSGNAVEALADRIERNHADICDSSPAAARSSRSPRNLDWFYSPPGQSSNEVASLHWQQRNLLTPPVGRAGSVSGSRPPLWIDTSFDTGGESLLADLGSPSFGSQLPGDGRLDEAASPSEVCRAVSSQVHRAEASHHSGVQPEVMQQLVWSCQRLHAEAASALERERAAQCNLRHAERRIEELERRMGTSMFPACD